MALTNYPNFKAFDPSTGGFLVGGLLYTYDAGTSTPKATYQDKDYLTPHTNPIVLDANGEALIFTSGSYKLVLKTSAGVTLWTRDSYLSANGLIGDLTPEANKFPYYPTTLTAALTAITALGRSLLARATAQLMRNDIDAPSRALGEITAVASGTDTYTANLDPAITEYTSGAYYFITFTNANTAAAPTINLNSLGAKTIKNQDGSALVAGEIRAGSHMLLKYNGTDMIMINMIPTGSAAAIGALRTIGTGALEACAGNDGRLLSRAQLFTSSGTWTRPSNVSTVRVIVVGGGGGGGAAGSTGGQPNGGGGGGRGCHTDYICTVTGNVTVTVGGGGAGGTPAGNPGATGSTGGASSFGALAVAGGGIGGTGGSNVPVVGTGGASGAASGTGTMADFFKKIGQDGQAGVGGLGGGNISGLDGLSSRGNGGAGGNSGSVGSAGVDGYVLVLW